MGVPSMTVRRLGIATRLVARAQRTSVLPRARRCLCTEPLPAPREEPGMTKLPPAQKVLDLAEAIVNLNLLEASQLNDVLKERLGISDVAMMPAAAMPAGGAAPAAAAEEAAEEKTSFDVVLSGFDAAAKIKVIKEIRGITSLGLKEAKELVENAPKTLKDGISKEEAEEIKTKIEAVGGKVELK